MTGEYFFNLLVEAARDDENKHLGPYMTADEITAYNQEATKDDDKYKEGDKIIKNLNEFKKIQAKLRVLARSAPDHKALLVRGLRQMGHVVAVTGDGTNDAPALTASDVGFAMKDGSDILISKADMVLLTNDFCSILIAIKFGRNVYDNVRKFLQY
jgi:magnesium-transporting ATPase (P-type)